MYLLFGFFSLFSASSSLAHGISEEAKRAMVDGGLWQYMFLGAEHMVTGYDHILFLLGVIFFLTSFREILKFVSLFTLGHSLTLVFATYLGITANAWLVDAVIALSVCYKGFDNNMKIQSYFRLKRPPSLTWMVFFFGLVHGFGLSTRLQDLPLGERGPAMLAPIISFNLGVEFGQIIALALMLLILSQIRNAKFFPRLSKVANDGLVFAGFLLLLMQLHGYLHQSNPDEFGFSEDQHLHHHENIISDPSHYHDSL